MEALKQLGYKQKNLLLLAGAVLLGIIAYQRAIKGTFEIMAECSDLEQRVEQATNSSMSINNLQAQIARLDLIIGKGEETSSSVQNQLLKVVSQYCEENKMHVSEVTDPYFFQENDYTIHTNIITVRGKFVPILELIHSLEQDFEPARMASVKFYTSKNRTTKKKQLYAKIYMQNIEKA